MVEHIHNFISQWIWTLINTNSVYGQNMKTINCCCKEIRSKTINFECFYFFFDYHLY